MTPLQHIDASHVRCPQCRVGYRVTRAHGKAERCMCEVPGCKRLYQTRESHNSRRFPLRMYIDPADIERGLA